MTGSLATNPTLQPGTAYVVPANMDAIDMAGFRQRLIHARTLFADAQVMSLTAIDPPNPAAAQDGRPLHQTEYRPGGHISENANPIFAGDLVVVMGWSDEWGRVLKIQHSASETHKAFAVIEPVFADGSNDFEGGSLADFVLPHIDRWIALASDPLMPSADSRLKAFDQDLWPTIYALMQSHPGEIYEQMAGRLRLITGQPFGLPALKPNRPEDNMYSVDQFLTPEAASVLASQMPTIFQVWEKTSISGCSYTFSSCSFEEPPGLAIPRDPGSVIGTMKRLQPFAHLQGRILVPDVELAL